MKGNIWHWYLALHSCIHKSHTPTHRLTHTQSTMHTMYVHRHKHKHLHSRRAHTHKHIYCIRTETNTKQINIPRHTDGRQTDRCTHVCWERIMVSSTEHSKSAHLMTFRKYRKTEGEGLKILSKGHSQWPNFFHLSPKCYRFHISKYQPLGDQDFIPRPLYTFEAPNITACITFCMLHFPAMLTPPLRNTYYFWIKALAVILVLFSFLPIFNFYATVPIPINSVSYLLKRLCITLSQLHKAIWKLCWI